MPVKLLKTVLLCAVALAPSLAEAQQRPVYLDTSARIEERIEDALSRMTLDEKIAMIHAQSKFSSPGVPRLGIPELWCTDGPHGIRPEVLWDEWEQAGWTNDSCTAYPALTALAATWNRDMAALYGRSIGAEARYREKDVLLGPGVNIYRTPLGGRNFEYMGEDPYLAGEMAVPYIREVQKQGVAACVKHYALNNEETHRHTVDIDLDDRALYEIYLPAFRKAVVEGGAWSIMGSYNLYRGVHGCHNDRLLNHILKGEWGFDGAVVSDWGGTHSTDEAVTGGLDIEYGTWTDGLTEGAGNAYDEYFMATPYRDAILAGRLTERELDDKVRRVLRLIFRTAMNTDKPFGAMCSEEQTAAARRIGGEGIVLLRNERGTLPISSRRGIRIAVIGENAVKMMTVGGGSSSLKVKHECSPLEGIAARAAACGAEVVYARGYVGDTTGSYNGVETGQNLADSRSEQELIAEAVEAARNADYTIFVGGLNKSANQDSEGTDRLSLDLPYGQDRVIEALAGATDRLVVALVSGNAVAMPWVGGADAIVQTWYLGSEAGNALADVLFGDVTPSGKLPFTFPVRLQDVPAHALSAKFPNDGKTYYHEGIFVGYRGYEHNGTEVLFPFGHGLSYTTFEYGKLRADRKSIGAGETLTLSIDITNTGGRRGSEVVQLYIADPQSSLPRPVKELKGFEKISLEPGQTRTVTFTVDSSALSYYDDRKGEWVAEGGEFEALAGSSSADIRARAKFRLK